MVPSDRMSQNVGSKKSKSNQFRKKYYLNKTKIPPQCLSFQFHPMINAGTKKFRKASMIEPFLWLWWLNVEHHFIVFLTVKMFRPRISLKIGRFGPRFQWMKCRSIFWKENQRIVDQFVLPFFSARTFLSGKLAILKSGFFLIQIFLFGS